MGEFTELREMAERVERQLIAEQLSLAVQTVRTQYPLLNENCPEFLTLVAGVVQAIATNRASTP